MYHTWCMYFSGFFAACTPLWLCAHFLTKMLNLLGQRASRTCTKPGGNLRNGSSKSVKNLWMGKSTFVAVKMRELRIMTNISSFSTSLCLFNCPKNARHDYDTHGYSVITQKLIRSVSQDLEATKCVTYNPPMNSVPGFYGNVSTWWMRKASIVHTTCGAFSTHNVRPAEVLLHGIKNSWAKVAFGAYEVLFT